MKHSQILGFGEAELVTYMVDLAAQCKRGEPVFADTSMNLAMSEMFDYLKEHKNTNLYTKARLHGMFWMMVFLVDAKKRLSE